MITHNIKSVQKKLKRLKVEYNKNIHRALMAYMTLARKTAVSRFMVARKVRASVAPNKLQKLQRSDPNKLTVRTGKYRSAYLARNAREKIGIKAARLNTSQPIIQKSKVIERNAKFDTYRAVVGIKTGNPEIRHRAEHETTGGKSRNLRKALEPALNFLKLDVDKLIRDKNKLVFNAKL